MPELDVAYLCLQATAEGQASHAHVHEIAHGLERRGIRVRLFEPRYAEDAPPPSAAARALAFRATQRRLMAEAADTGDVLYVRAHFAAGPAVRWAQRRGIPVVQEVNGGYEDVFAAWPWTRRFRRSFESAMRQQYRTADALVTVTDELAAWLEGETARTDVTVIPNGANVELFRPDSPVPRGAPARYALFFGALAPWQGVPTLLAAVSDAAWPEGVSLVIAGDGAARREVEAAALRDERVVYAGKVPYADVPGWIAGSLVGLVPKEGKQLLVSGLSPIKLYETLACGVPVVVSDLPGQAAFVREHDVGLVVPPGDPRALAEAVARFAADGDAARETGRRGRALIEAGHSWEARAEATARVIEQVARSGPRVIERVARSGRRRDAC